MDRHLIGSLFLGRYLMGKLLMGRLLMDRCRPGNSPNPF
jgi:hypothetical protein